MPHLEVHNVTKSYNSVKAVDGVSFSAEPGRIFGLLGPNGAGKTSTIRMITYITIPDSGHIHFDGEVVGAKSQERMGYLPEERGLYKKMKVKDQLIYLAQLKGMSAKDATKTISYWLERFDAGTWGDKKVTELSKGMQQKVQFISTIAHDPSLLIFDEPFSGLDPINSDLLQEVILELKQKGKTILFASHRMEQVEQMCDEICLVNHGKSILSGNLREIKKSYGRNTMVVEFSGDESFVDVWRQRGLKISALSNNHVEVTLQPGIEPRDLLNEAMSSVELFKYELVEPSLNEIFISEVQKAQA